MDESVITTPEISADSAAEDAAFTAGFATDRGEEAPEPVAQEDGAEVVPVEDVPPEGDTPPEPDVTPAAPAESPKLFAGLTEEQIGAALARSGSMQTTVDKMAGRIGQLMQQIEALRASPPTTQQAQKALDLKLEKLSGAFPELANLLREDLKDFAGGSPAADLPAAAPAEDKPDDSWKAVTLRELVEKDGLPAKVAELLEANGLDTLGKVTEYTDPNASGWCKKLTDFKGFGPKKLEEFEQATANYWGRRSNEERKRRDDAKNNGPSIEGSGRESESVGSGDDSAGTAAGSAETSGETETAAETTGAETEGETQQS